MSKVWDVCQQGDLDEKEGLLHHPVDLVRNARCQLLRQPEITSETTTRVSPVNKVKSHNHESFEGGQDKRRRLSKIPQIPVVGMNHQSTARQWFRIMSASTTYPARLVLYDDRLPIYIESERRQSQEECHSRYPNFWIPSGTTSGNIDTKKVELVLTQKLGTSCGVFGIFDGNVNRIRDRT